MVEEDEENCLDRPASRDTDAGNEEGSGRRGSIVTVRLGARFRAQERRDIADCLRYLREQTDMSLSREKGGEERVFKRASKFS